MKADDRAHEIELSGGRANHGRVVRIGDEVARPRYPQTDAVDDFLAFLSERLDFVPEPRGTDADNRQRLTYLPGEVPTPPYPQWAFDERLLVDVARHQGQMHQAAREYQAPDDPRWATSAGDYFPAGAETDPDHHALVCHNDLGMSNTVVDADAGRVIGFIDFDYCRPVNPLFDIAVAARHWVPFGALDVNASIELDRVGRFTIFCDVHALSADQRRTVIDLAIAFLDKARGNLRRLADEGNLEFRRLLDSGYEHTNRETIAWLDEHREVLANGR